MFDKHKGSNKGGARETEPAASQQDFSIGAAATPAPAKSAIIGPGIHIIGEVTGEDNILIEGKVEGKIDLTDNEVTVGNSGRVNADVIAKTVKVAGQVRGDISGKEKVVISQSGNVRGNIIAPRVTLEDGAKFKGSIDMDPGDKAATELPLKAKKAPAAAAGDSAKPESSVALKGH
jgi:cytoskeletal protein CcmA (bactofilin family)